MPTAVENNAGFEYGASRGFEYGGLRGFEYGGLYSDGIRSVRGIPESLVNAVVARGRGISVEGGRTLYSDDWTTKSGKRWRLFVITLGGTILTSWVEQG